MNNEINEKARRQLIDEFKYNGINRSPKNHEIAARTKLLIAHVVPNDSELQCEDIQPGGDVVGRIVRLYTTNSNSADNYIDGLVVDVLASRECPGFVVNILRTASTWNPDSLRYKVKVLTRIVNGMKRALNPGTKYDYTYPPIDRTNLVRKLVLAPVSKA